MALPVSSSFDQSKEPDAIVSDSIIDFKGIVVACQAVHVGSLAEDQLYDVTLFYDSITEEQRTALALASQRRPEVNAPPSGHFPHDPAEPFGFDRVCGLN